VYQLHGEHDSVSSPDLLLPGPNLTERI